jgi:hypothetical protein
MDHPIIVTTPLQTQDSTALLSSPPVPPTKYKTHHPTNLSNALLETIPHSATAAAFPERLSNVPLIADRWGRFLFRIIVRYEPWLLARARRMGRRYGGGRWMIITSPGFMGCIGSGVYVVDTESDLGGYYP